MITLPSPTRQVVPEPQVSSSADRTGISIGERRRPDGTRTSALPFTTSDLLSPLGRDAAISATFRPGTASASSPGTTTSPAGPGA